LLQIYNPNNHSYSQFVFFLKEQFWFKTGGWMMKNFRYTHIMIPTCIACPSEVPYDLFSIWVLRFWERIPDQWDLVEKTEAPTILFLRTSCSETQICHNLKHNLLHKLSHHHKCWGQIVQ
jgi:hypothetical protein